MKLIQFEGDRMRVFGPLTLDTAREATGTPFPEGKVAVVDLSGVTAVDSAALGVLMHWSRQCAGNLVFANIPASLRSLADLYDVSGMLAIAEPANSSH